MKKKKRPGFMIFHDDMVFLDVLCDEDAGKLLKAMIRYSATDEDSDFESGMLQMGWMICRTMLDRDKQRYQEVCDNNSYSAYCKNADARGEVRMSKEAYCAMKEQERTAEVRAHACGTERVRIVPTATTTPTSTATAISTANQRDLDKLRPYDATTFEKVRNERMRMIPVC